MKTKIDPEILELARQQRNLNCILAQKSVIVQTLVIAMSNRQSEVRIMCDVRDAVTAMGFRIKEYDERWEITVVELPQNF